MIETKNITIIDDDPITVFGIRKMLKSTINCENIDSYANGKMALEGIIVKMQQNIPLPNVIFLDINMPIMDGWQFLESFVQLPIAQKIKINIITSSIDSVDIEKFNLAKDKTHHEVTYNNKPINRNKIEKITKAA